MRSSMPIADLFSVSRMAQRRCCSRREDTRLYDRMFFFAKNRQVLCRHPEQREAYRDNHERDRELGPLRHIVMSDVGLEADKSNVQAVGDEPQHRRDGSQIQKLWRNPHLLEAEHGDGNDKGQRQFDPEEIGFVARLEYLPEQAAVEEVLETKQKVDPQCYQ